MRNFILLILLLDFFTMSIWSVKLQQISRIKLEQDIILVKNFKINGVNFIIHAGETDSIRIVKPDGKQIRTISGKGKGPGEFFYISDFCIDAKGNLIVAGSTGGLFSKVAVFDNKGSLVNEKNIKHQISSIFISRNTLYYASNDSIHHIPLKKGQRYNHYTYNIYKGKDTKPCFSIPDTTRINPHAKSPYPWFPAPFPNRIIPVSNGKYIYVFQTKENYLLKIKDPEKRINFKAPIKKKKVTSNDKLEFMTHIEETNRGKLPPKLKGAITFPEFRSIFRNVIRWNNHFGIILDSEIRVIDSQGNSLFKVLLPDELNQKNEETAPLLYIKDTHLYTCIEGEIIKYKIHK